MSVAAVLVDTGLAHLDRAFEYSVPDDLVGAVSAGVRVKVRFAGRDLDGFVVGLRERAEHPGRLQPIRRVISPEPVLTPAVLAAAEQVAAAHAGLVGDVLRLAVPPRHARAEQALALEAPVQEALVPAGESPAWARYPAGPALLRRLAAGQSPQAAWSALPTTDPALDWPAAFADAAAATVVSGRGAILLVPDHRDVVRLEAAVRERLGRSRHVVLTADQGPQARYTAFLRVLRGHVPVVVGTRAAAWAPVADLGRVAWWVDGDDLWEEPRAPDAHLREVARVRARIAGAALVTGGFGRSVPVQAWVAADVVKDIVAPRESVRAAAPRVVVAGEEHERDLDPVAARARIPGVAWRTAKAALERGPVLVQVPRRGYLPSLAWRPRPPRGPGRPRGGAGGRGGGAGPPRRA